MSDNINRAAEVLIAHTRTSIEACHCGWGRDATELGKSHAQHVAQALADAGLLVTPEHDAEVRADERAKALAEIKGKALDHRQIITEGPFVARLLVSRWCNEALLNPTEGEGRD